MSDRDRQFVSHIPPGGNYRDIPNHIATPRILRFKETGGRTTTYGRLHPDEPAYTINTYFRRPNVGCHFHYEYERLITAREAMRFQSLPDAFDVHATRQDERNALIGNAVPALLAQAVAESVRAALCIAPTTAVSNAA
jgi:DNA (cytosine-5)-methyltransferase 1